jgi:phenylalanyl-tRNA synthetase alpha chain
MPEDLTLPANGPHAIQLVIDALERELGRDVPVRRHIGSPIVSVADNYDRLRYRADDVTRSRRYTRYVDDDHLMRSHTTAHLPGLLADPATRAAGDVLLSVPGMCYRRDVIDRHHVAEPHQHDLWRVRTEGPPLDDADLCEMVARVVGLVAPGRPWHTPDSPHPYTIAGREIMVGDVEIGECGLIHPALLADAGLGPDASGLAMGLGLDRLVMLVKGIPDVRLLRATDERIASQMRDLEPYRAVSSQPPIRRDLSVAIDDPDPELLGDRIRDRLGSDVGMVEEIVVLADTPYEELPAGARTRMGMRPGQHNLLLRLVLRDHARTLTDAQANQLRDLVYAGVHQGSAGEWTS